MPTGWAGAWPRMRTPSAPCACAATRRPSRWASATIEHGHLMDDASIATLKKNGTYLVPTLFLTEYMQANLDRSNVPEFSKQKMRDVAAAAQINAKRAISAGVKVAFGTDAAVYPHGLNAGEFHVYVKL